MRTITIPATSANLGPGFDCLGVALGCYNSVSFEFTQTGLAIDLQNTDLGRIPSDERNLVYRVFAGTLRRYDRAVPGVRFSQKNGIPAMRGMGSSAACAVAGVVMANEYLGHTLTVQQMIDLCTEQEGHPDNILPALLGGFTVGCMDEKQVRYVRFTPPEELTCAVFIPPFSLSTRKARAALPAMVTLKDAVFNLSHASLLTAAIAGGQIDLLQYAMRDALHQPYRMPLVPGYREIVRIAQGAGAMATCLSGAGPTMISFLKGGEGFLEAVRPGVKALDGGWRVKLLNIDPCGYRVE
ncbi:MAG TPA: homoserine kinase [Feifaniaceae bacterium]|nr:homoserine kinase [Feifaniaceae bacterium]